MDSRSKIITPDRLSEPVTLVTGYFDLLRVEHARELAAIRERTGARALAVVVLGHPRQLLPLAARAALVAGLHMVDYVLTVDHEDLTRLIERVKVAELVRLETVHAERSARLIEHVQRSQIR